MKISANLIIRDEASTLEDCLRSIRPHVDELVIVDTGSTDGSQPIAKRYADRFEEYIACNDAEGRIEDFSAARNYAKSLSSGDWLFWCDGDDIIEGAEHLRGIAAAATADNVQILMPYEYSHDSTGRCTVLQWRERLVRPPHRFTWDMPVHETLIQTGPVEGTGLVEQTDRVRVIHRRNASSKPFEPQRNLRILRGYVDRVGETNPRAIFYLGIEHGIAGNECERLHYLKRYVEIAQWPDEQCIAMLEIARCYLARFDCERAERWALRALTTKTWPEPYFVLGMSFYELAVRSIDAGRNYRRAAHFIQLGLTAIPHNDTLLWQNPKERFTACRFLAVALAAIGDLDGAIRASETGIEGLGDDPVVGPELQNNLRCFRRDWRRGRISAMAREMLDAGEINAPAEALIRNVASGDFTVEAGGVEIGPAVARGGAPGAFSGIRQPGPGGLSVVFYVGHGCEPWNPETVQRTGIGGSELMALEMAERLATLGHGVTVFGHCTPSLEGEFDGVLYVDASRYRDFACDVLIVSRRPHAVDRSHNVSAMARVLWVHDVHCGDELTQARDLRFDLVWALSEWHKRFLAKTYPKLDPAKIEVTRNGIDPWRFYPDQPPTREPNRVLYTSSPDRGLGTLLELWPNVLTRHPNATLHVYYGFQTWRSSAEMMGDQAALRLIHHLESRLRNTPNVVFHGRVNQERLTEAFLSSGLWVHPTWFSETFCIGAAEAWAAGCRIVASDLAALSETVGPRGVLVPTNMGPREDDMDWRIGTSGGIEATSAWRARFTEMVVRELGDPLPEQPDLDGIEAAFGLDSLAVDWDARLRRLVESVGRDVVPAFHDSMGRETEVMT